jgi:hypothetical protein
MTLLVMKELHRLTRTTYESKLDHGIKHEIEQTATKDTLASIFCMV